MLKIWRKSNSSSITSRNRLTGGSKQCCRCIVDHILYMRFLFLCGFIASSFICVINGRSYPVLCRFVQNTRIQSRDKSVYIYLSHLRTTRLSWTTICIKHRSALSKPTGLRTNLHNVIVDKKPSTDAHPRLSRIVLYLPEMLWGYMCLVLRWCCYKFRKNQSTPPVRPVDVRERFI